jgi:hypothetical protein
MNASDQLARVRRALYVLAILVFSASIAELLASKHYGELLQLIPFAIAGLGILTVIIVWRYPRVWPLRWAQAFLLLSAVVSLLGMYFHVTGNAEFVRELQPNISLLSAMRHGLTGRDPILAPGVLAMGAFLAFLGSTLQRPEAGHSKQ